MRWLLLAAVIAGGACDPVWSLRATVRSPQDAKLERAALVLTGCEQQNEHDLGTVAALTDEDGEAVVGGLGDALPASCAITIAKPGYATYQSSFRELCGGDTEDCDRVREIAVTLTPVAAPAQSPAPEPSSE